MLTADEIRLIMTKLRREVVVAERAGSFPYEITQRRASGWSDDPEIASLEAKLSMMLEAATRSGG